VAPGEPSFPVTCCASAEETKKADVIENETNTARTVRGVKFMLDRSLRLNYTDTSKRHALKLAER